VVATAASAVGGVSAGSVDEADSVGLLRDWRRIAAAGVEKGIPSLVDFGRMMWLVEVGSDERLTEDSAYDVARAVGALERKYSQPRPRPEEDLAKGAHVALFDEGYTGGAEQILAKLGLTYARLGVTFDPLFAAAQYPVLFVPSGGLYGTAGSADLRERFRAYVEAGGTLLVMAQMRGVDLGAVPAPPGEVLSGFGWYEDQSCFRDNVRLAALHPILAGATREVLSVPVDGYLDRWPADSTVLLRRAATGTAAMLTYPLGAGHVIVSTIYDDWAEANRTTSPDGLAIIANALAWGRAAEGPRPECRSGGACTDVLTVTLRNLTEDDADTVEWSLRTSTGEVAVSWSEPFALPAGAEASVTPAIAGTGGKGPGIYRLFCSLQDSGRYVERTAGDGQPWVVQPAAEVGQILLQAWPAELAEAPRLAVGLTTESELVENHASIAVFLTVQELAARAFEGRVEIDYWAPGVHGPLSLATMPVSLAAGGSARLEATVGPLDLQPGHDGLAGGGTLRARVFAGTAAEPAAVALRNVLTNARLLEVDLVADPSQASSGETVSILGMMHNQSLGSLSGRYRLVFTNRFSAFTRIDQVRKTDWKTFSVPKDTAVPLAESFTVPADWQGAVFVRMHLCYPDLPCWTDGNEGAGVMNVAATSFQLPMPKVRLTAGNPVVVEGPAIRVPVRVANVGVRIVDAGEVRLGGGAADVRTPPFSLALGGDTDFVLELPFEPAGPFDERTVWVSFTDRTWRAADAIDPWRFAQPLRVSYGADTTVASPLVALPGSGRVSGEIAVHNLSTFPRRFRVDLECPDLGYVERRWIDADELEVVRVPIEIPVAEGTPYGWTELAVRTSDGAYLDSSERFAVWLADPDVRLRLEPGATPRAGFPLPLEVGIVPRRLGGELPGTVELALADASWASAHPVVLRPDEPAAVAVEIPLPADLAEGPHAVVARWRESNGFSVEREFVVRVAAPRYEVRCTGNRLEAGGVVTYEVGNVGGAAGSFAMEWVLRQGFTPLVVATAEAEVPAGAVATLEVPLPADLVTGSYLATGWFCQGTGEAIELVDPIAVSGVTATLDVATEKPVFRVEEPVAGLAAVRNGDVPLEGGRLHLEVLGVATGCARPDAWGVFQGNAARDGYSRVGRLPFEWPGVHLVAVAGIPASGAVVAAAAGDLDGDGRDDVVVVENGALTAELAVYAGPNLTQRARTALGQPAATSAVAVGSVGGQARVFTAEVLPAGGMRVRAFDGGLGALWEAPPLAAAGAARPFPGGGPLFADLTGDGREELVVSTGADVLALDVTDGRVVWSMSGASGAPSGWTITGMSAGDVTGDGAVDLAVAFVTSADPPGGALGLVAAGGSGSWRVATVNPTVGAPVLVPAADGALRVAVVETPADPALSSSLVVVDAGGTVRASSTFAFWSAFQPAAADLDGDGRPELVVVTGDVDCRTCGLNGVVVFRDDASVLCFDSAWPPAATTPILIDLDGRDAPDLTTITAGGGYLPAVEAWETAFCGPVAFGETDEVSPLLVLDIDGDCLPELFAGTLAFATIPMPPGASAAEPARSAPAGSPEVEVVWSWDGPLDLAAAATEELWNELGTGGRTGFFTFAGRLENALGQVAAEASSTFAVVDSPIELSFSGLAPAYAPAAAVELAGTVRNAGELPAEIELLAAVDGVALDALAPALEPGDESPYAFRFEAGEPGAHLVEVTARADGVEVARGQALLVVEEPAVSVTLEAPPAVGSEPFQVCAHVVNPTRLALQLELASGVDPDLARPEPVALGPGEQRTACTTETLERDAVIVARVSGDAEAEASAPVVFDAVPRLEVLGATTLAAGDTVIEVEARNSGTRMFAGPLGWELTGSSSGSGTVPLRLEPGAATVVGLPVRLAVGASQLAVTAGPSSGRVDLIGYSGGVGTLSLTVPAEASAGPVDLALAVTNALSLPGTFAATVEVHEAAGGGLVAQRRLAWQLAGGAAAGEAVTVEMQPGDYRVEAWLEGDPTSRVLRAVAVRPRRDVALAVALGALGADGALPLSATITNAGADAAAATLAVALGGEQVLAAVTVPPGGSIQPVVPLQVDALPAGTSAVEVVVLDDRGDPEAAATLELAIAPPRLALAAVPVAVDATAGTEAVLQVPVANAGMQTGAYRLALELAGGSVFSGAVSGALSGGGSTVVPIVVPLSAELPDGILPGRLTLLAERADGALETVATRDLDVVVHAYPLAVTLRLDRDSAVAGETVGLEVDVTCPPGVAPQALVGIVTYGDHEERRELVTGGGTSTLRFEVPVDQPGRDVLVGLHWPSGRAAYLGQLTVHPSAGVVVVRSPQPEWLPGDVAVLDVTLERPGTLELFSFQQSVTLESGGQAPVTIPEDTAFGEYPVIWTFYGAPPDGGILNGSASLRVRGPHVRITAFDLPATRVSPGDTVPAAVTVRSDTALDTTLRCWLEAPSGEVVRVLTDSLRVEPDRAVRLVLPVEVATAEPGTHTVIAELRHPRGAVLVDARARLDVGAGALLDLRVGRAGAAGQFVASVTTQGDGPAVLALELDGIEIERRSLSLDGVETLDTVLAAVEPGDHVLEAVLSVGGLRSSRSAAFSVPAVDLAPDCTAARAEPAVVTSRRLALVPVAITGVGDPEGGPVTIEVTGVRQDEPGWDWLGAWCGLFGIECRDATLDPLAVRAWAELQGDGRVYHVSFTATDAAGNAADGEVTVCVPLRPRLAPTCVDGGPLFDSTGGGSD